MAIGAELLAYVPSTLCRRRPRCPPLAIGIRPMPSRADPFPFEAARDLLGILRALHAATEQEGGRQRALEAIQRCGQELRMAIGLARRHEPNTLGYDAAWRRAEA